MTIVDEGMAVALRPISVLIIDDDGESRELLAQLLRNAGYSVTTAGNGHEGLDVLHCMRPELILLDVNMPIMDGRCFREAQRHDRAWLAIPTVVMTADPNTDPMLDIAVEDTLHKPVRFRDVMTIVAQHCAPPSGA